MTEIKRPYLERIAQLRKLKKMSQADVADWLGLEPSAYGKIELGRSVLTVDRAYQLANIFEVPITDIINTDDAEFLDIIRETLREPAQKYHSEAPHTSITINIGGNISENSPEANKFLERLNALFRADPDADVDNKDDEPGQ